MEMLRDTQKLDSWFISGFSDAESSFNLLITPSKNNVGWRVEARFVIHLHSKDSSLLYDIKSFFNEIGNVKVNIANNEATFLVSKFDDLYNIIIPHFDNFPLQSAKRIDYQLWKECLILMKNKAHLTQSGLDEIISIKANLNKGLSDKLKLAFPNIIPKERPLFKVSDQPLNPFWVSGFSEGDSSFCIIRSSKTKYIRAFYKIGLNNREEALLLKIKAFFNDIGIISYISKTSAICFDVTKISDLVNIVIPHFNNYKLAGNKLINYEIWSKIVLLMNEKAHLNSKGLDEIENLISNLNK